MPEKRSSDHPTIWSPKIICLEWYKNKLGVELSWMNHLSTSCFNSDWMSLSWMRMICFCRLFCCCVFLINHRCRARCHPTDTFIQKTKQRYNSPRSLSTRINLADMQTEIKLRPPYQLSPEDLRAVNGFSVHTPSKYKGIGRTWAAHTHACPICSPRSYGSLWWYILHTECPARFYKLWTQAHMHLPRCHGHSK